MLHNTGNAVYVSRHNNHVFWEHELIKSYASIYSYMWMNNIWKNATCKPFMFGAGMSLK